MNKQTMDTNISSSEIAQLKKKRCAIIIENTSKNLNIVEEGEGLKDFIHTIKKNSDVDDNEKKYKSVEVDKNKNEYEGLNDDEIREAIALKNEVENDFDVVRFIKYKKECQKYKNRDSKDMSKDEFQNMIALHRNYWRMNDDNEYNSDDYSDEW